MAYKICMAFVFLAGVVPNASAQMFIASGHDTLRSLPGVEVIVESTGTGSRAQRIDGARRFKPDVERRLAAAGIAVYHSQNDNPSAAKAYLYVQLDDVKLPGQDLYAIGVQVQLRQTLRSAVTTSNIVDAMTWDAHTVLVAKTSELVRVGETIQEYTGQFIRDWGAVH